MPRLDPLPEAVIWSNIMMVPHPTMETFPGLLNAHFKARSQHVLWPVYIIGVRKYCSILSHCNTVPQHDENRWTTVQTIIMKNGVRHCEAGTAHLLLVQWQNHSHTGRRHEQADHPSSVQCRLHVFETQIKFSLTDIYSNTSSYQITNQGFSSKMSPHSRTRSKVTTTT